MQISLALTALFMGLAGSPHCIAMCGAACAGIGRAAQPRSVQALLVFQGARLVSYAALGALAAASMQGLGWLSGQSAALRPLWTLVHVAAVLLGLVLLVRARQPLWLDVGARRAWAAVRKRSRAMGLVTPLGLGLAWALLPCGLLYSAVMVAALSGSVVHGAAVMALFAVGSGLVLLAGPWLLLRLGRFGGNGGWGVRVAGLALVLASGWALWMGVAHAQVPWCTA